MNTTRILILGDSHVPRRAKEIKSTILEYILKLSQDSLFDYILFTGDLIKYPSLIKFLTSRTKHPLLKVVGNMDYFSGFRDDPLYQKLDISIKSNGKENKLVIGLTHGAQIQERGNRFLLEDLAKDRNYNILVSGHSHKEDVFLTESGILLLNPGSITGAWSFIASGIPTFIEMDINIIKSNISIYLYQYNQKRDNIDKETQYFEFKQNKILKRFI